MLNLDLQTWDIIAQFGIAVFGVTAIILVARKNKWGFVVGLFSQPFWFATALINKQWGVMALNVVFLLTWVYGIYEWFYRKTGEESNIEPGKVPRFEVCKCGKHAQIISSDGLYFQEVSSVEEALLILDIEIRCSVFEEWFSKEDLEVLKKLVAANDTLTKKITDVPKDFYFKVLRHSEKLLAFQNFTSHDVHIELFGCAFRP